MSHIGVCVYPTAALLYNTESYIHCHKVTIIGISSLPVIVVSFSVVLYSLGTADITAVLLCVIFIF